MIEPLRIIFYDNGNLRIHFMCSYEYISKDQHYSENLIVFMAYECFSFHNDVCGIRSLLVP